jgi:hypothetical protein
MYKAIKTSVLSVEPGRVIKDNDNTITVSSEPLSTIHKIDKKKDCVVLSLASGPNGSITDHVLDINNAEDLFIGLLGALCAAANPIALTLRDSLPLRIEDIPIEYRA